MRIPAKYLVALCCVAIIGVSIPVVGFVTLILPTNDRDNANPEKKAEMRELTLEWGRLAPFPKTAQAFEIYTEGNLFTRTFKGSFTDTPENIKAWLLASPGVAEGEKSSNGKYILKTSEGVAYGEVVVSPDHQSLTFEIAGG